MQSRLLHALWLALLVVLTVPSMGGCADVLRSVSDSADNLASAISGDDSGDNLRHDLSNVWDDLFK